MLRDCLIDMYASQSNNEIDKWVKRVTAKKVPGQLLNELGAACSLWDQNREVDQFWTERKVNPRLIDALSADRSNFTH